jgi:hypothetical protein
VPSKEVKTKSTITFFCIATNKYNLYAKNLISSIDNLVGKDLVQVVLLTDGAFEIGPVQNITLTRVPIASLQWPWATLMRYHLIYKFIDEALYENICYVDADSILYEPIWRNLDMGTFTNGIALVRHPGYFRKNYFHFYSKNIQYFFRDLKLQIFEGGLGNWEKRKDSKSFVRRRNRKTYVCGGLWMGKKESIRRLAQELSEGVNDDLSRNLVARWHDESYLNRYLAEVESTILSPAYCHARNRPNLKGLDIFVEAIDK